MFEDNYLYLPSVSNLLHNFHLCCLQSLEIKYINIKEWQVPLVAHQSHLPWVESHLAFGLSYNPGPLVEILMNALSDNYTGFFMSLEMGCMITNVNTHSHCGDNNIVFIIFVLSLNGFCAQLWQQWQWKNWVSWQQVMVLTLKELSFFSTFCCCCHPQYEQTFTVHTWRQRCRKVRTDQRWFSLRCFGKRIYLQKYA